MSSLIKDKQLTADLDRRLRSIGMTENGHAALARYMNACHETSPDGTEEADA